MHSIASKIENLCPTGEYARLRQIGEGQQTGHVYLSDENTQILDDELQQNFRLTIDEINDIGAEKVNYEVRVKQPPVKVTLQRIRRLHQLVEKQPQRGLDLELDKADTDKYRLVHRQRAGLSPSDEEQVEDLTASKERRDFSELTLCAEIARYLKPLPSGNRGHPKEHTGRHGRDSSECQRI